jgi:hypothetical protein
VRSVRSGKLSGWVGLGWAGHGSGFLSRTRTHYTREAKRTTGEYPSSRGGFASDSFSPAHLPGREKVTFFFVSIKRRKGDPHSSGCRRGRGGSRAQAAAAAAAGGSGTSMIHLSFSPPPRAVVTRTHGRTGSLSRSLVDEC